MSAPDVFISYPHLSNRDNNAGQNGWVAKFHKDLQLELDDLLGREALVWRDNKMPFGTVFSPAISDQLLKTKVLLCVLSPAYLQSDWCRRELDEFRKCAQQNGGLRVGEQSRIIAVVKTPVDHAALRLSETIYCEFFDVDDDRGGVPRSFSPDENGYKYQTYKERVTEVAWSIARIVSSLRDNRSVDAGRTVYLAETSGDAEREREAIKHELEDRKLIVLPTEPLPQKNAVEYAAAVAGNLDQAFLSVHLLGKNYGLSPEGADGKSIVDIQNDLAAQRSAADDSFRRVIWIPKDLQNAEARQLEFLDKLRCDEMALAGAEIMERSFEDFKTRLLQILTKQPAKRASDNLIRIYLMCDREDEESLEPVGRFLFQKGYEVILPPEERGTLKYHKNSLLRCDAALTIYGKVKFEWVQERYVDTVDKIKGWGRGSKISLTAILPMDPETLRKRQLFFRQTKVLSPCYNGLSPEALEKPLNEFIDELENALRA
jgi:TIR domain-containing protein